MVNKMDIVKKLADKYEIDYGIGSPHDFPATDTMVLLTNWNDIPDSVENWIERNFHENEVTKEWSDEHATCDDCGRIVRTSPNSYGWERNFIMGDGCIICRDCFMDNAGAFIDDYINDTNQAFMSWAKPALEQAGFYCMGDEDTDQETCARFETGWHPGQNDDPKAIAKYIEATFPDCDYVFAINSIGQFDCFWSVWLREK